MKLVCLAYLSDMSNSFKILEFSVNHELLRLLYRIKMFGDRALLSVRRDFNLTLPSPSEEKVEKYELINKFKMIVFSPYVKEK